MTSGIYCIENVENGKQYIGKSERLEIRMWENHRNCIALQRAIEKYDDAIIRYVVQYCEPGELIYWEQYYIREWKTKKPNGYNLTDGGEGISGYRHTEELKKKWSKERKGEGNARFGTTWSEETRKIITEKLKGRKHSEETKEKMRGERPHTRGENSHWFNKTASDEFKKHQSLVTSGERNPRYATKLDNKSSKYFGVYRTTAKSIRWAVIINVDGKRVYLKSWKNEEDAARIYDKYVVENNLNRPLNFPEDHPNRRSIARIS